MSSSLFLVEVLFQQAWFDHEGITHKLWLFIEQALQPTDISPMNTSLDVTMSHISNP